MIKEHFVNCKGVRLSTNNDKGEEIGHVYLYIMYNDLHDKPFGFVEDLFVEEKFRGQKYGKELINKLISKAKKEKCYKLIANSRNSRPAVHSLYEKIGFQRHGFEFRMDF